MTEPYYQDETVTLHHGDCLDVLAALPDASVDAVVTDPPYGLEFMGKGWDAPWEQADVNADAGFHGGGISATKNLPSFTGTTNPKCLVCKGTRRGRRDGTAKVAVCLCENGGVFPNIRAVEMRAFQEWCEAWAVECLRVLKPGGHLLAFGGSRTWHRLAAAVEDAGFEIRDSIAWLYGSGFPKSRNLDGEWQGWGTALKPAFEPVVVGRKPLAGTVAANVLTHGTGVLNIDACRVPMSGEDREKFVQGDAAWRAMNERRGKGRKDNEVYGEYGIAESAPHDAGRWPPNVALDESQAAELDRQSGVRPSSGGAAFETGGYGGTVGLNRNDRRDIGYGDTGGASRFFPTFRYEAKAPTSERPRAGEVAHPTVKPLDLMRWLVRLVTPPGGLVLEPFAGSGTTAEACVVEGFRCIAIEREADYLPLITQRLMKPIALTLDIA